MGCMEDWKGSLRTYFNRLKEILNVIKFGYFIFMLTLAVGVSDLYFMFITTRRYGVPNSMNVSVVYGSNISASLIAIIAPISGYILIKTKTTNLTLLKLLYLGVTLGFGISVVGAGKSGIWLSDPEMPSEGSSNGGRGSTKYSDMKDYTFRRELKSQEPSSLMIGTSREEKCCGIRSFVDWEEIYGELEAGVGREGLGSSGSKGSRGSRKVPDFCCLDPDLECGSRIIGQVFDSLLNVISRCQESEEEGGANCREHGALLKDFPSSPPSLLKDYELILVTDPRIDPLEHRNSLRDLKQVGEVCSRRTVSRKVMIFYSGFVKELRVSFGNGHIQSQSLPCFPIEIDLQNLPICRHKILPIAFFSNSLGFCHWIQNKNTISDFSIPERIQIIGEDGRVFAKGCSSGLIKYNDQVAKLSLIFCPILAILLAFFIPLFLPYHLRIRTDELSLAPKPRWYDPLLLNEQPALTAFGDLDFIPDHGLSTLPPMMGRRDVFQSPTRPDAPLQPLLIESTATIPSFTN